MSLATPQDSAAVATSFSLAATATTTNASASGITAWKVYVDGAEAFTGPAGSALNANLKANSGAHELVVTAWDSTGASGSETVAIIAGAGLPTPPSSAKTYKHIEKMTSGWESCNAAKCAGGNGGGNNTQAFNQTTPSLSGSSMELYKDGAWTDALWWHHMGPDNHISHLLWDFYVQVDKAAQQNAAALEYDAYQFVDGYNYMVGSQCNYGAGVWDTWAEDTQQWLHTKIPCNGLTPGTWHHIQWYVTIDHVTHTYTYGTLVVDGKAHAVLQTQHAVDLKWDDQVGVQWQLDVNANGGGYHEWVDNATLTTW